MAGAGVVGRNFEMVSRSLNISHYWIIQPHSKAANNCTTKKRPDDNIIAFAETGQQLTVYFNLTELADVEKVAQYLMAMKVHNRFSRSSTIQSSRTSTTPRGKVQDGKISKPEIYAPDYAMHNVEYVATASPTNMKDMVDKLTKAFKPSKKGFAIFTSSPPVQRAGT
jgi:hypothetical protein